MGRALEPNYKFPIILDWDKEKPVDKQPMIYTLALSMRRSKNLGELLDNLPNSSNSNELFANLESALAEVIYDWKNFRDPITNENIPYSRDKIMDFFTTSEAYEVIRKVLASANVTQEDQKKLEQQP